MRARSVATRRRMYRDTSPWTSRYVVIRGPGWDWDGGGDVGWGSGVHRGLKGPCGVSMGPCGALWSVPVRAAWGSMGVPVGFLCGSVGHCGAL